MGKFLASQLTTGKNLVLKKGGKCSQNLKKSIPVKTVENVKNLPPGKLKRKIIESGKHGQQAKKAKFDPLTNPPQESEYDKTEEELQECENEIPKPNITFKQLDDSNEFVLSENNDIDLFCSDEYNSRYDRYTHFNFMFTIFDEIALEGLDGITLEALWKRLKYRLKFPTLLDNSRNVIWKIICANDQMKFYQLPEPRGELVISDVGIMTEEGILQEVYTPNIYKAGPLPKDAKDLGSCSTYTTREDITVPVRNMTYFEAYYTFGNRLVIVADQEVRTNALVDDLSDPTREVMVGNEYCMLERIGRARDIGDISHGLNSTSTILNLDPQLTYYYKKHLIDNKMVVAQMIILRSITDPNIVKNGRLLHLRRFYNQRKSKTELMTENIINYLKTQPDYRMTRAAVLKRFHVTKKNNKNLASPNFLKYVSCTTVPYRTIYPDAQKSEYLLRHDREREISVMQLIDPYVNVSGTNQAKIESSDEEEENTIGTKSLNLDLYRDLYLTIYQSGLEGERISDLKAKYNVSFYTLRHALKRMTGRNNIQTKMVDSGKTKVTAYIATCHLESDNTHKPETIEQPNLPAKQNNVLERLKAKQQKAIEMSDSETYTKDQFLKDQEQFFENNIFLPVIYPTPDIKCVYLVQLFTTLNTKERKTELKPLTFNEPRNKFSLKLESLVYTTEDLIEVNNIWGKFNKNTEDFKLKIEINFEHEYKNRRDIDTVTMLFLLRAHFEEIEINKPNVLNLLDTSGYFENNTTADVQEVIEEIIQPQIISNKDRKMEQLNFMGNNPVKVVADKKDGFEVEILQSTRSKKEPMDDIQNYRPKWALTDRMLDRARKIINIVNERRVLEEFIKLSHEISALEAKEGYDKKIDRKSILRLVKHLVEDGFVKVLILNIKRSDLLKTKKFICVPEETHLHPYIQSQIDQLIHKYFTTKPVLKSDIGANKKANTGVAGPSKEKNTKDDLQVDGVKVKQSPFVASDVLESISKFKELKLELQEEEKNLPKHDAYFAKKYYGFQQKFVRMSILHEILFYLIYEQPKTVEKLSKDEIRELFREYQINLVEEDLGSLPPLYCKEISWKMFVPPLPIHFGWPDGWALICDIVLRLPISIILKIFNCTFVSREVAEVLNHPIKRYFLLGYHSDHIKRLIMANRKYVYDVYHNICNLAYCGLVQFGPTKLHQKDQVFIYLNRRASLLNTVSSSPGYHKIEDREYPKVTFTFNNIMDVHQYWSTLYDISMNTKLNSHNAVKGRTITIFFPTAQLDLQKTLVAKTAEEAIECDTGVLPGDHRGASGLDSSLWVHKNINWISGAVSSMPKQLPRFLQKDRMQIQTEPVNYSNLEQKDRVPKKIFLPKTKLHVIPKTKRMTLIKSNQKGRLSDRHVKTKFVHGYRKRDKRNYYDHVDLVVLKRLRATPMSRSRFKWTPEEDKVLILLKVATILLTKSRGVKQNCTYTTIRDALHIMIPSSAKTKTSRAVQRRFKIIFKSYKKLAKIEMNIPNLMKLEPIAFCIKPLMDKLDNVEQPLKLTQQQLANAFLFLVSYIWKNRQEVESALQGARLARSDYLSKENIKFTETNLDKFVEKPVTHVEPSSEENIIIETLKSALISALSSRALVNESLWSYLVFATYRKFRNVDIKSAIDFLFSKQLISRRRFNRKSQMQFCISNHYVYGQNTTYSFKIAEETYKICDALMKKLFISVRDFTEIHMPERLALAEISTFWWMHFDFKLYIPDYMIILNPNMDDHSEIIDELAKRYHIKLKNEQELKAIKASVNIRSDPETVEIKSEPPDYDIIDITEDNDVQTSNDLIFKSGNTVKIADLRNWIEGCIDVDRSRSPSPERLINREPVESEKNAEQSSQNTDEQNSVDPVAGEGVLSIAEIKEEMMKEPSTSRKRTVPYVLDLIDLLSENFEEIDSDGDNMKKHLIPEFPTLEEFGIDNFDEFKDHHLVKFLDDKLHIEEVWTKIRSIHYVGAPVPLDELYEVLLENGGSPQDISLVDNIVNFVARKEIMGVSASSIKSTFSQLTENLSLEFLLSTLTKNNILIQTGVCSIIFVHHFYKNPWLLNVTVISEEEKEFIEDSKVMDKVKRAVKMETNLENRSTIDMKVFPWVNLDGEINTLLLKIWLTNVLSHCIENPKLWLRSLLEKYFMLKPVDAYFLLEILQELGCVRISKFGKCSSDMFSQLEIPQDCAATSLDNFDDIFIEPSIICFSALGSFFVNET